jgi:hypothetical protein
MKFISILLSLLLISGMSFGQKNIRSDFNKGIPILVSGVIFTVGVSLTPLEYSGGINSKVTPYYLQTAQIAGLTTGITLTGAGLITTLLNKKGRRKGRKRRW